MKQIYANNFTTLELGRQGENLARQVVFDIRDLESLYGSGTVEVIYQRPGDTTPHPLAVQMDGTLVTWDVTATDTEMSDDYGKCELRYYVGDMLAKSKTWRTLVEPALPTPSETAPPEPEQGWVEQVLATGVAAQQAADAAKADADKAATLAAEVAVNAAQTAQDASKAAKAMEAAQTAQRLAEEAQSAAEAARTAAAAAQAAAETAATDVAGAKQDAETAQKAAQDAAAAAAKALEDIRALYQEMQTWAQGVIRDVNDAGSAAVQSVQSAGDTQVQRVTDEGTTQTANVKAHVDEAKLYADEAKQSATDAHTAKTAAETARDAAVTAQSKADAAQKGAEDAKAEAEASKEASATNAAIAMLSAQNAKDSEDAAKASEDNAAQSATDAQSAMTAAQTAQSGAEVAQSAAESAASSAATSAGRASVSEQNAAGSASAAKASEDAAKAYETTAAGSASSAQESAASASASASEASASATAAAASETSAVEAKTAAETAKTEAGKSASAAKKSETASKASETAAAGSASAAQQSASAAEGSATAAAQSAASIGNAEQVVTQKAEEASTSAANAAASAEAAAKSAEHAEQVVGGDFATKTEAQGYANTAESNAKAYADQQIAAIPTPDVSGQIGSHNTNTEAHNDIRELITGLTNRLNALADSDDTTLDQLSEIVVYIKSNRSLIEDITTSKVNVADIIDNLTTNVSNKPLSAAQGVVLKALIDAITVPTKVSELENDSGYLTRYTETDPTVPAWAKAQTKPTYTASEVGADASGAAASVQSNLDGHTGNTTVHITAAERTKWNGKQDKLTFDAAPTANSTNPVTSDGVKTELDKKASATSLGAHTGNTDNPHQVTAAQAGADPTGTAASAVSAHNSSATAHSDIRTALAGKETAGAAASVQSNLDGHTGNTTVHITAAERTKWNGKQDKLTFDAAPTANSTNPVTSDGVKTELDKKASATSLGAHTGNTDNPHQVTAAQAGADPTGTAASAVSAHNSSATAHSDIRTALAGKETAGAAASVQSNLDGHTGNTTVHITAAERTKWNGKSGKAVSFTVTLTAAGWSGNTQNVSNSKFVTSGYAYTVCPAGDSFAGYAEAVIYADDVTTAGKMTFHCNEAPTVNLTVNILRTEATA